MEKDVHAIKNQKKNLPTLVERDGERRTLIFTVKTFHRKKNDYDYKQLTDEQN